MTAVHPRLAQLVRYGAVPAIATATSLTVLGALVATRTTSAGWANVIATGVGTVPSFELNRRWVWGRRGARSVQAEVVPFCALSAAGLVLSTLAVTAIARWADAAGLASATRTLAVQAANLAAFGSLWLAQFLVLDRLLFADRTTVRQDARAPSPSR
jgi:putative flippase GtrA